MRVKQIIKLSLIAMLIIFAIHVGMVVLAENKRVYLSDIEGNAISGLRFLQDETESGSLINVGGIEYEKGIVVHPDYNNVASVVVYNIEGLGYEKFYAIGGKDKSAGSAVGGDSGIKGTAIQMEVYVDGELKADSGILLYPDVYEFIVDIAGAKELKLVVKDGGDTIYCDATAWAQAQLLMKGAEIPAMVTPAPPTPKPTQDPSLKDAEMVYISDMAFDDWVCHTNEVGRDGNIHDEELYISGEYYEKGIMIHAIMNGEAYVDIDISGLGFKTFASYIGLAESMKFDLTMGTVVFRVYGDGELLYESETKAFVSDFEIPELISVDVTGVEMLRLAVGNADGNFSGDMAAWGGARLSKLTDLEEIMATPEPTATPEKTPVVTSSPTEKVETTDKSKDSMDKDKIKGIWIVLPIIVGVLVIAIVVVFMIKKKGSKVK